MKRQISIFASAHAVMGTCAATLVAAFVNNDPLKKPTAIRLKHQTWRSMAILAICLATSVNVSADPVADWNAIAVQATITGARPGATGVLDIAMVQAAIYDAVQAIERRYEPYYVEIKGASGSPVAAAAKAAHDVLVNRFPSQTMFLDMTYQQYLFNHGLADTDPGVAVGAAAANGIIALRACDGSFPLVPPPPFIGGTDPGVWRPTPPGFSPMAVPWLGSVTPFTLTRPSQFRAAPPPALTSGRYARDYNEVKVLGALNNSARTPEQTDIAHFWAGNTLVIWNRALRDIANAHVDNIGESARLFALADMAIADALITSWNDKTHYVFWRPITAIREADNDGNPRTASDSGWLSLINTPNYPDYTSGAVNFATAATRALKHFFRTDRMTFSVTTTNTGPTVQDTRRFERFSDAAKEVVDARIYAGIHFRFADEAARKQGGQVANWAFNNFLSPLDNHGDGDNLDANVGCDADAATSGEQCTLYLAGQLRTSAAPTSRGSSTTLQSPQPRAGTMRKHSRCSSTTTATSRALSLPRSFFSIRRTARWALRVRLRSRSRTTQPNQARTQLTIPVRSFVRTTTTSSIVSRIRLGRTSGRCRSNSVAQTQRAGRPRGWTFRPPFSSPLNFSRQVTS